MGEMQTVIFSLNNELCGADTSQVQEIVKYQEITKVPRMPKFMEGIVNLRGRVVPVINLNKRFELGETELTRKTKIIITRIDDNYAGFIVNDVLEILKISDADIEAAPDIIKRSGNIYLKCVAKKGEKLISILDLNYILTENEVKRLKTASKEKTA